MEDQASRLFYSYMGILLGPLYGAACAFLAAFILKWWTERRTREYEQQTKRLKFVKAYYDVCASNRSTISAEFDQRSQTILRDASVWFESRRTKGYVAARSGAIVLGAVAILFVLNNALTYLSQQNPAKLSPHQEFVTLAMFPMLVLLAFNHS